MKCFSCAAKMVSDFTTYSVDVESGVIVIRHVPCFKCTECGEVFFSAEVVEKLERIVEAAKKTCSEVYVSEYDKAAA